MVARCIAAKAPRTVNPMSDLGLFRPRTPETRTLLDSPESHPNENTRINSESPTQSDHDPQCRLAQAAFEQRRIGPVKIRSLC